MIALELQRLDEMLAGIYDAATSGNLRAIDRALKIGERRMRILGLERERIEHSGTGAGPAPVADAAYAELVGRLEKYRSQLRPAADD